jgi:cytoskeletal protein CcmA (bactofilin family)
MADSLHSATEHVSVLGSTLRFKGDLSAGEDLLIHGQVEGNIGPAPRVTIGPEARLKATVTADVIVVEGHVEGDLNANESIIVRKSAQIRGNIQAPIVNIAEGAKFNGGIKMEAPAVQTGKKDRSSPQADAARTGTSD